MKNNENKIKEMLQGRKSSLPVKTMFTGAILTPLMLPTIVNMETKAVECVNAVVEYGNKSIFFGSGVSNWWLLAGCGGLLISAVCEAKLARIKSNKNTSR